MNGLKVVALESQNLLINSAVPAADSGWGAAVTTEFTKVSAEVMPVLLAILGIALGIFGLQWGVRKAMKFFKSTTN
ncbi:MAG: hypothetical protein RR557_07090 [Bacilli bacterium]